MNERKRLHGATKVCCLLVLVSTLLSAQFVCEIWHKDATAKTLTFGMVDQFSEDYPDGIQPFPPDGPVGTLYFLGRASATEGDRPTDFFRLANDMRPVSDAATWTLKSTTKTTVSFKFAENSSLPAGAILMLGDKIIDSATSYDIEGGQDYQITYRKNGDVPVAPAQPENIQLEMVKVRGNKITTKVSDTTILDGTYAGASIVNGVLTYEVNGREADKVQFNIVNVVEVNGVQSQSTPATVIITFTDGIALSVVSENTVILKAGDTEGGATTVVQYEVAVGAGVTAESLDMTLTLPAWTTMMAEPFPYTAVVTCGGQTLKTDASAEDKSKLSFTLPLQPEQSSYDLLVTLTAGNDAESKNMVLEAAAGVVEGTVTGPYIYIEGSGTLDFDGNGKINKNDAVLMYNFANFSHMPPAFFDSPAGLEKLRKGLKIEEENLSVARDLLISMAANLDFDGNGKINKNDAVLMYNFANFSHMPPAFFDSPAGLEKLSKGLKITDDKLCEARDILVRLGQQVTK